MMKKSALVISYIFHPIVFFFLAPFLIVFRETNNIEYSIKWGLLSAVFIFLYLIFIAWGVANGKFSDLDISKKEERKPAYIFGGIEISFFLITVIFFKAPPILIIAVVFAILGLVLMDVLNKYAKASVHVASISAFVILLSIAYKGFFSLSLLAVPLMIWSRLKLKRHTIGEALLGAIAGTFIAIVLYLTAELIV